MTFLFYFQTGQISKSKRRFEKGGELNLLWRFWLKKKYVVKNIIFMDLLICDKLIIKKKNQLLTPKYAE